MSLEQQRHITGEEKPQPLLIPYKEFLKGLPVETGTILTEVKPHDLFTYQKWLSDEKIINVYDYIETENPRLNQITGYFHYHDKFDKDVIVIGNGNHRALYALLTGKKINVEIENPPNVAVNENPFRLTNLARKYPGSFVTT